MVLSASLNNFLLLGMQHLVILESEPWGLPLNEPILPEYLKTNGYTTHAIGKWHLGFFKKEYTPTFRGFDTHYGYWQGLQDYYEHTVHATYTSENGYDMRRNMSVDYSAKGKYSTTLFTEEAVRLIREHDVDKPMFMYFAHLAPHSGNNNNPLQAPDEEIAKFVNIECPERRVYAAMVSMLDKSVGKIITALRNRQMLQDSIVLFMSDNGAQPEGIHANYGSNFPFRGAKNSAWEGGTRNLAAIWSPLIMYPQRVHNHVMHISDWLPTFFTAAGLNKTQLSQIDGLDMWSCISEADKCSRTELVYNIDDIADYGAIRVNDWKYIYGSTNNGRADRWFGNSGKSDKYVYDIEAVLSSKVATSLAGVITQRQIKEKGVNLYINLLNEKTLLRLRQESTIKCAEVNEKFQSSLYQCDLLQSPCLFNISNDPCEQINLLQDKSVEVTKLVQKLVTYRKTIVKARNAPRDPKANPINWKNTWINWKDYENIETKKQIINYPSIPAVGLLGATVVTILFIVTTLIILKLKKSKICKGGRNNNCWFGNFEERDEEIIPNRKGSFFESRELQSQVYLKQNIRTVY